MSLKQSRNWKKITELTFCPVHKHNNATSGRRFLRIQAAIFRTPFSSRFQRPSRMPSAWMEFCYAVLENYWGANKRSRETMVWTVELPVSGQPVRQNCTRRPALALVGNPVIRGGSEVRAVPKSRAKTIVNATVACGRSVVRYRRSRRVWPIGCVVLFRPPRDQHRPCTPAR